MVSEESREVWDRLDTEPERAYRAFASYLDLSSSDRTLLAAYRSHVGNPEAVKPSDTWSRWSHEFAWRERAAAYDDHLASMRREAFKSGIEEEAARQGALAERNRHRFNELMTVGYEESMRWFEEVGASGMRASDAIQVMRLHLDAVKTFEADRRPGAEDDWTEEDDAEFADTVPPQIEAETDDDDRDEDVDDSENTEGN